MNVAQGVGEVSRTRLGSRSPAADALDTLDARPRPADLRRSVDGVNGRAHHGPEAVATAVPGADRVSRRITVFGAGYVGLVAAACFAELGHTVTVCDIDEKRIRQVRAEAIPFHEPGLARLVTRNRERMSYTTEAQEALVDAEVAYVCVNTPPTPGGDADLSRLWTLIRSLEGAVWLRAVVIKSTVPVGTGERVRAALDAMGLRHVGLASNPEFTAQGQSVRNFLHPDRVVVGASDDATAQLVEELHHGVEGPVVRMDIRSAEMVKLAANALLATKISFINEIAAVCEHTGADVTKVAQAVGMDHRLGGAFLNAGIGWGGSCLSKDSEALKKLSVDSGHLPPLLSAVIEVNAVQRRLPIQYLEKALGTLDGARVALLGLAFKPGTDDIRDAPSTVLAERLLAMGAEVRGWDPLAQLPDIEPWTAVTRCETPLKAMRGVDAALVVTEWPELGELDWAAARSIMRHPVVFDGRNLLNPARMRSLGFDYSSVGRPVPR
ncbi:MAG: UDP-glucose/GDP-mannose dehydrogenase family protein [Catenulispora sp.]|nr:UDP-glucose/GDP-mannose dehydrogenase family protein [Catenulispora sp.]